MWSKPRNAPRSPWSERGRVAYLILYALGLPVGVLLVLWVIFGNNLFGPG
ncbi:hypothetical protein SAMN02949497_0052 [Methylomagnum ishizawai]|uniref:Uncharacterized protein n=1 Tax=Methylomagnum ishizawai TaxID=1760988 RepID=A0A1Y6D4B2_9GAMM|nr:hypothetical protein [Methylomagnum ishizawai]SMF97789.1 hypothetical protein SAMN02949497_0052 [Methylomagnum ishizawai]